MRLFISFASRNCGHENEKVHLKCHWRKIRLTVISAKLMSPVIMWMNSTSIITLIYSWRWKKRHIHFHLNEQKWREKKSLHSARPRQSKLILVIKKTADKSNGIKPQCIKLILRKPPKYSYTTATHSRSIVQVQRKIVRKIISIYYLKRSITFRSRIHWFASAMLEILRRHFFFTIFSLAPFY